MKKFSFHVAVALVGTAIALFYGLVGGLALMGIMHVIHNEVSASVPALGYFTSALLVFLARVLYLALTVPVNEEPGGAR